MKKLCFLVAALTCLVGCNKAGNDDGGKQDPISKVAKLQLEWKQSDNIKDYTAPLIAYRINGGKVVIEAPGTKSIDLPIEGGKVEIAFFSGTTSKDLSGMIDAAKANETVSYTFSAEVKLENEETSTLVRRSFNYTPLSQSYIKDNDGKATIDINELKTIVFDEFNCGNRYDPSDRTTRRYEMATGKERKLVFTWQETGKELSLKSSYESGNLFQ